MRDEQVERVAKAVYESQRKRLFDQASVTAARPWRDESIPDIFWKSFVDDARAAIAAMGEPWRPIDEDARNSGPVLCGWVLRDASVGFWDDDVDKWCYLDSDMSAHAYVTQPTRWMPLPAPPVTP